MIRRSAAISLLWSSTASAKLSAVVESNLEQLGLSIAAFFAVLLAWAIAGALAARRIAPSSRIHRQFIFAAFNIVGLLFSMFIALKVVRA